MKTNIGITCVDSLVGQGIIRSIRKSDLSVKLDITGFEYFDDTLGSHWIDRTYIMPDILKEGVKQDSYIDKIIAHIKKHDIKLLFIGIGFELEMMAGNRKRIEDETGCTVIVSDEKVIDIAEDKYKTYLFLKENGIPCPDTWLPSEIDKVRYPAIVKPRTSSGSRGLSLAKNRQELESTLKTLNKPVIQENVGKMENEYTCGVTFFDGEVKTEICLRRTLRHGNTYAAFNSPDTPKTVYDYINVISKKLKPFGPCNYQLRTDKDGTPKMFEINARFSGTTYVRHFFGINEVEYTIKHLLGMKTPKFKMKYGKVLRYLEDYFVEDENV
ncbi:MAG: ATP-grasp domain-containing protein [Victivallales bacterium]